jgi:hypothetical protein
VTPEGADPPMPPGQPGPEEPEAKTIWTETVALARDAAPRTLKCRRVISAKTRLAFIMTRPGPAAVKAELAAYLRIARCAEQVKSFGFLEEIGRAMRQADPENGHPEILARAQLGKGRPERALRTLESLTSKRPDDPHVAITFAKIHCAVGAWAPCKSAAERALTLAKSEKTPDEERRLTAGAYKYVARALAHTGALDEAAEKLALAEQHRGKWSDIEEIREEIAMARSHRAIVRVVADDEVPLGTYHLVGKLDASDAAQRPLRVSIDNFEEEDTRYRIEVEIAGVTQPTSETVTVKKGGARYVDVSPNLLGDFDLEKVRAPKPSSISVKVTKLGKAAEELVVARSVSTTLLPRDYLPMGSFEDERGILFSRDARYVAAWVTPNDKSVDKFLAEAKAKLPKGRTFDGPQSTTQAQVKALFEALRARGVSYVMDPEVLTADVKSQRTRLPAEVLATTNAQCLEGSILYASLLEAIGLSPIIVYVPGHAFVGWKPSKLDKAKDKYFFLETTMTGGSGTFERAMDRAKEQFTMHDAKRNAVVADVQELRKLGVTPQPLAQAPVASGP